VIESLSWEHGVMLGAAVKSEATSAAEFKGRLCTDDVHMIHVPNTCELIVYYT